MRYTTLIYRLATVAAITLAACKGPAPTVAQKIDLVREAVAEADYNAAQHICDDLATHIAHNDTTAFTDIQAGELAMLFMALSEHQNEDENVAVATRCLQFAYDISPDSLRAFSATLPLDEQRHFELLRRISISIDNPVDLMGEEFLEDETIITD